MTRAILLIHYLEIQMEMHFRLESIHFFVRHLRSSTLWKFTSVIVGLQALVDRGLNDRPRSSRPDNSGSVSLIQYLNVNRASYRSRVDSLLKFAPAHKATQEVPLTQARTMPPQCRSENVPFAWCSLTRFSRFLRRGPDANEGAINGQLMAQYLMTLLSNRNDSLGRGLGDLGGGRMGDYVFNQEGRRFLVICSQH